MAYKISRRILAATALSTALWAQSAYAQEAESAPESDIVVTGSRIPRADLQGISPVAITTGEQIKLARAVTIEDFSVRLPQLVVA